MSQLEFLQEVLTDYEFDDLTEIMNFSLDPKIDLEKLQESIALASFHQSKLTKIMFKIRLMYADLETEFESWHSRQFHSIAEDYDGFPELLKTTKDYEREIRKLSEYKATKSLLRKMEQTIHAMQTKEKELSAFDWKVKGIIDLHKIQHNIMY